MLRKLFALVGLTVGLGVVGAATTGCSSTVESTAVADASLDVRPANDSGDPTLGCFSTEPINATKYDYKSPRIVVGACTQKDIDVLVAYAEANPNATFNTLRTDTAATIAAGCGACVFSAETTAWAPFVLVNDRIEVLNASGCIEIVSGKGTACGEAHRQWDQCLDEGCLECTGSDLETCSREIQKTACKAAADKLGEACGSNVNAYLAACRGTLGFDKWIEKSCVTGPTTEKDASTDG